MDTLHDLGGKKGFGPIPIRANEDDPFQHDWERRMWALSRANLAKGITIDWFRHGIERMVPSDYMSYPYFNKWATDYLMMMIDNGQVTLEEVLAGHTDHSEPPAEPLSLEQVLEFMKQSATDFSAPSPNDPR